MGSRLSACLYIAKAQLQVSLAYRFQVFASLLSQLIILVASVFFWRSAYGTQGPLGFVKDVLVRILSGSVVPLWFFPQPWQGLLQWLPFPYIYPLPLGIYIGKYDPAQALEGLGIQAGWALALAGLFWWLHRRAEARVMVQGG